MSRPIPTFPHGPRRRRSTPASAVLLACPRVSPEWELSTLAALMRPTAARRGKVEHLGGGQDPWPAGVAQHVMDLLATLGERLPFDPAAWDVQLPAACEYFLVARVPAEQEPIGRAVAVVLSRALPGHWWVLGRLFVRDGRFFRRRRGYRLELVEATDVHLRRDVRAKLKGLLRKEVAECPWRPKNPDESGCPFSSALGEASPHEQLRSQGRPNLRCPSLGA